MKINNIHDLAEHFGTTALGLDAVLSNRARVDVHVDKYPTYIRIGTFVGECNAEFCILCTYPFESSAVDVFIDTVEHTRTAAYDEAFDDPVDMLMNLTDPGMNFTLKDATEVIDWAEIHGWHLDPQLTPEDILNIYHDLEPEEEDE